MKNKIEKTRSVVGEYTSAIETLRLIRDKKLAEIRSVQLKIEVNFVHCYFYFSLLLFFQKTAIHCFLNTE